MKKYFSKSHGVFYLLMAVIVAFLFCNHQKFSALIVPFTDVSLTLIIAFSALIISVTNLIKGGKPADLRRKVATIIVEFILLSFFILFLKLSLVVGVGWLIKVLFVATIIMIVVITAEIIAVFNKAAIEKG